MVEVEGKEGRRAKKMYNVIKITVKTKVPNTFPTGQYRSKVGGDSNR